jgi:hypothetical protein
MKLVSPYGRKSPRFVARVRIGVGLWLVALTAIMCGYSYWWGVLLLAPAALHFYLAYRLLHGVRT